MKRESHRSVPPRVPQQQQQQSSSSSTTNETRGTARATVTQNIFTPRVVLSDEQFAEQFLLRRASFATTESQSLTSTCLSPTTGNQQQQVYINSAGEHSEEQFPATQGSMSQVSRMLLCSATHVGSTSSSTTSTGYKTHVERSENHDGKHKKQKSAIYFHAEHPLMKKATSNKDPDSLLEALPNEVLYMILRYLPSSDVVDKFEYINRRFNSMLNDEYFWKKLVLAQFGDVSTQNRIMQRRNHYKVLLGETPTEPTSDEQSHVSTVLQQESEVSRQTSPMDIAVSRPIDIASKGTGSSTTSNSLTRFSASSGSMPQQSTPVEASFGVNRFLLPKGWKNKYRAHYQTQENWRKSNYAIQKVTTHPCYITPNSLVTILGEVFDIKREGDGSRLENVGTITCAIEVDNCLVSGGKDGFVRIFPKDLAVDLGSEIVCIQHMNGVLYVGCENSLVALVDLATAQVLQTIDIRPQNEDDIEIEDSVGDTLDELPASGHHPVLCMAVDEENLFVGTLQEIRIWKLEKVRRFTADNWSNGFSRSNLRYEFGRNQTQQNIFAFDEEQPEPLGDSSSSYSRGTSPVRNRGGSSQGDGWFHRNTSLPNLAPNSFGGRINSSRYGTPTFLNYTGMEHGDNHEDDSQYANNKLFYFRVAETRRTEHDDQQDTTSAVEPEYETIYTGSSVYCVQIMASYIMAGSEDGVIRMYNRRNRSLIRKFVGHRMPVVCLQFDKNKLVSGGADSEIKVWDPTTGMCIYTLRHHTEPVWHLRFDDSRLLTSSFDRSLVILDFEAKEEVEVSAHNSSDEED